MAVVKRLNSDYNIDTLGSNVGITAHTVTVNGNLIVLGSQTSLETTNTAIFDNVVTLNAGTTGTPVLDAGIEVDRGNSPTVGIRWHEPSQEWQLSNDGTTWLPITTGVSGVLNLQTVTNNGNVTTRQLRFTNTTSSTNVNSGALVVSGGLGVGERIVTNYLTVKNPSDFEGNINAYADIILSGKARLNGQLSNTAPLDIAPGTLVNNPDVGNLEFDGNFLYITTAQGRQQIQLAGSGGSGLIARAVAVTNISVASPSASTTVWDGITLAAGNRVLLTAQTNPAENGVYVYNGAGVALTRAIDFSAISEIKSGTSIVIAEGTLNRGTIWQIETVDPITVGSTAITIAQILSKDSIDLARLVKDSSSGFITRTSYGSVELRSVTANSSFINITNGDGKLGNIVINTTNVPFSEVVNGSGTNLNDVLSNLNSGVTAAIAVETTRATTAEAALRANITAANIRITNLGTAVNAAIAAETVRATAAESSLQSNISAEIGRATAAESSLQSNIATEISRATAAEAGLQSSLQANIDAEANARIAGDTALNARVDYVIENLDPAAIDSIKEVVTTFSNVALMATQQSSNVNITGGNITVSNITSNSGTFDNITTGNLNVDNFNVTGNVNFSNLFGNTIPLGTNTVGSLSTNAVSVSTTYDITDTIALMNVILGKLVPQSPPNFPAGQSLSITGTSTYRMTNFTQTDNTATGGKSVSAGSTVTTVRRVGSYTTNTITTSGPGDSGTVTVYKNGSSAGSTAMVAAQNGTYSDLTISSNQDYHNIVPSVAANFWYSFNAAASGTVSAGWNEVYIRHTGAGQTNAPSWYYDAATPGTPQFSGTSMVCTSNVVIYSSTIPHYTNTSQFTLTFTVNRLSGDTFPTSDTFVTGTAGGALTAPASVNYATAGVTTPLARNLYVASGGVTITTTSSVISGFGSSSYLVGPSVSVNNSYAVGTQTFAQTGNVLYKTGTSTQIEELSIPVNGVGTGSGNGYRIVNPGTGNTPSFTGLEAAFDSAGSTLQTYDATVVGAVLKHDVTDYSTGYLPAGPNLSLGRSGAQYFTFKFVRTVVSKFDVKYTGTLAGLWVALPGSAINTTSTLNGWLDMSVAYNGSGIPGAGAGGNGSNGCAVGGTATLNSAVTNKSVTATFGTVSSSSTVNNIIYVRVRLTGGQSLTALSIETATH
jgi:hypothetical protein